MNTATFIAYLLKNHSGINGHIIPSTLRSGRNLFNKVAEKLTNANISNIRKDFDSSSLITMNNNFLRMFCFQEEKIRGFRGHFIIISDEKQFKEDSFKNCIVPMVCANFQIVNGKVIRDNSFRPFIYSINQDKFIF